MRAKLSFIIFIYAGLTSCNKLLDVDLPPNEVSIEKTFNDSSTAVAAVAGIYNKMVSHGFFEWCGLSNLTARSADDAEHFTSIDFFALDSLSYTDFDIADMWQEGFSSLLTINTCIEGLQSSTGLSATLHRQLLGESFFCRAFVNFYLVNLWGDALPLITSAAVEKNQFAKSVPQQQVYDQVISDLLQSTERLTNTYAGRGRVRPNLQAANALLARVYLYQKRYSDAIAAANLVIGSNLYSPLPPAENAFLQTSREAIWQLMPSTGSGETGAVGDVWLYKNTGSGLTPALLSAFETNDRRRQHWVIDNVFQSNTFTTANKYKDKGSLGNTNPTEYYMVLRLAEQYLIRAEASARSGQTTEAITDINIVRARAGLPSLPLTLSQAECILAVEHERRVELFTEWGHRWLDLKRWPGINNPAVSRADEVLGAIKRDWQSTDQWYPVPRAELQLNNFLVQNPGYPAR